MKRAPMGSGFVRSNSSSSPLSIKLLNGVGSLSVLTSTPRFGILAGHFSKTSRQFAVAPSAIFMLSSSVNRLSPDQYDNGKNTIESSLVRHRSFPTGTRCGKWPNSPDFSQVSHSLNCNLPKKLDDFPPIRHAEGVHPCRTDGRSWREFDLINA